MPETWGLLPSRYSPALFLLVYSIRLDARNYRSRHPKYRQSRSGGGVSVCSVTGKTSKAFGAVVVALSLFCGTMVAQQQEKSQTDIPDAPSASRPFPNAPPPGQAPRNRPPQEQAPEQAPPPNQPPPTSSSSTEDPVYAPGVAPDSAPPFKVTTVPQGGAPRGTYWRQRRTVQDHGQHQPGRGSSHGEG